MAADDEVELVRHACPHCLLVYNHGLDHVAGRYAALNKLTQTDEWRSSVADKYEYLYFPEEEIVQSVGSVNRYMPCYSSDKQQNGFRSVCLLHRLPLLILLAVAACISRYRCSC